MRSRLSLGKHRGTVPTWLSMYRKGGVDLMLKIKPYPGGVRVIPQWTESDESKTVTRTQSWIC